MKNLGNFNLGMKRADKLRTGIYIILRDYADGRFPPTFVDQARAYEAEIAYTSAIPGKDQQLALHSQMRKPFWGSKQFRQLSADFARVLEIFEQLKVRKGSRLLELGCGSGWTAEFFALSGYRVLGTSIAPVDAELGQKRVVAFRAKELIGDLDYRTCPMESVHAILDEHDPFDGVYVLEALHHAFDWRQAITAAFRCLRPGGWLVIANEPNRIHVFSSYRKARLTNTHEIGFRRGQLLGHLREAGFIEIRVLAPRFDNRISAHWIAARR